MIKFNEKDWLKPYIDLYTELWKNSNNGFENGFCKLMDNSVVGKTMKDARKHREIKLATKDGRRHYLVSEPNYDATKSYKIWWGRI